MPSEAMLVAGALLLGLCLAVPAMEPAADSQDSCHAQRGSNCEGSLGEDTDGEDDTDAAGLIQKAPMPSRAQIHADWWPWEAKKSRKGPLRARLWDATKESLADYAWPEKDPSLDLVSRTKDVGIAISGGGTRSYAAGYGQIRALNDLGLMTQARYLFGVSGGAWVGGVYTYHQTGADDEELLGSTPAPSSLTLNALGDLPPESLGWGATGDMLFNLAAELIAYVLRGRTHPGKVWMRAIRDSFLSNYGLGTNKYFSFNNETLQSILKENPSLDESEFILPARSDRPFFVMYAAVVGPLEEECLKMPFEEANASLCAGYMEKMFRPLSVTALYSGEPVDRDEAASVVLGNGAKVPVHEGGLVESFAFGGKAPEQGTPSEGSRGSLRTLPRPRMRWSLQAALGATSSFGTYDIYWYENGTRSGPQKSVTTGNAAIDLLTQPISGVYDGAQVRGLEVDMWDTHEQAPRTEHVHLGDGDTSGDFAGILGLIARKVPRIISFYNTNHALCSQGTWDPEKDQTMETLQRCISSQLPPLFGLRIGAPLYGGGDRNPAHLQVFPSSEFTPFVKAMQASLEANRTAYVRMPLTTVANDWRKIPAGLAVDLAMFYLSDSESFRAELPKKTREALATDAFKNFPLYETMMNNDIVSGNASRLFTWPPQNPIQAGLTSLTAMQVNLLAGLTGWAVLQHQDDIKAMFA